LKAEIKAMSKAEGAEAARPRHFDLRDWFAKSLGVRPQRKEEIYIDISRSATLLDPSYWLQILFAAGIATLGLILNSPAVIIGAMLISPLMGPILAAGLALATGDIILGLRAIVNLALSCMVAVAFAVTLVALLPFKEMTGEIAARTQPNTLDLVVALFSGAIGSIATCKEAKGIVTSIPGVAIAVALMPPLCVVGYGIGIAFSLNGGEGLRIASGGGLLFLTNLVAITFTAMIVFLALHIDIREVKKQVRRWRAEDKESNWVRELFGHVPLPERVRKIGSLPGRFLIIIVPFLALLFPLNESFNRLRREITQQQQENRIRQVATDLWQQNFARLASGEPRSYIDQLSVSEQEGRIALYLRVFTGKPCTSAERAEYTRLVSARLATPPQAVALQLVEIPTASDELMARAREERRVETPPTVAQLQASFLQGVESALEGLRLPQPARLVSYRVMTAADAPVDIAVAYLSEREIGPDAQSLIAEEIKARLDFPSSNVRLIWIEEALSLPPFGRNQSEIREPATALIDRVGSTLRQYPILGIEVNTGTANAEREEMARERGEAISDYLVSKWGVAQERILLSSTDVGQTAEIRMNIAKE
jgi:uncharacterized hydrophobic protein (TIGR00271 family)